MSTLFFSFCTMAYKYLKRWRRTEATSLALALQSSSSSEDNEEVFLFNDTNQSRLQSTSSNDSLDVPEIVESSESECEYIDSAETEDGEEGPQFGDELVNWGRTNNVTRTGMNELLGILRRNGHHLPKDIRTLRKTPRKTPIENKCGGQYIYFGLENGIIKALTDNNTFTRNNDCIELIVNADGIPVQKSSGKEFWPVLCMFGNCTPFVVAIFYGQGKPNSVTDYLHDFLEEYKKLNTHGLIIGSKTFKVSVRAFVCDAPARAFLKCTKGHTAFKACERCDITGTKKEGRTVLFCNSPCAPRIDERFDKFDYKDHQHSLSPLTSYGVSCVKAFPLDYMHLVCLGVVRRILHFLKSGPRQCRLSVTQIKIISDDLVSLNGKMPSDFVRQPRSLMELERWKATELRQFLLYTGPVVLKKVVAPKVYEAFMHLSVAISILLEENNNRRNSYLLLARQLLQAFVVKSLAVFGEVFVVYNVHNLLHIADDVEYFNCSLNHLSAFPFENHLQHLKRLVRCGQNPLAQVWKRINEVKGSTGCHKVPRASVVSASGKDSTFLHEDGSLVFITALMTCGKLECDVIMERNTTEFFTNPCSSKLFDIQYIGKECHSKRKVVERAHLMRKFVCIPYSGGRVIFPLLHGIETSKEQ